MEAKQTPNVFVIDGFNKSIVSRQYSENPKATAEELAKGYSDTDDRFRPKHQHIPTERYPNRYGIETPTDFFIHYLV